MSRMDDFSVLQANLSTLKKIFRPSSPTDDKSLFRGRASQLRSIMAGLAEVGQHILIYGERGVGKTSLGYMAKGFFDSDPAPHRLSIRVQCADGESFTQIWKDAYKRLVVAVDLKGKEFRTYMTAAMDAVDEILNYPDSDELSATDVMRALTILANECELLIFIDEFDRLGAWDETTPFGDLIKGLSDERTAVTLVIVGVADSIDGLIKSHASTPRSLRQILMPRMTDAELTSIVTDGYAAFSERAYKITCDPEAARTIAKVSQGFPYYAHLLAGAAGTEALYRSQHHIGTKDVFASMVLAIEDADHTIRSNYVGSTTARSDANLEATLVACALASADELSYFASTDVAVALSYLLGEDKKSGHVNSHLQRFSAPPHWVLERRELSQRKIRYRFRDPLMRPFVLLKGYQNGIIRDAPNAP
jgi:hypothetical protein